MLSRQALHKSICTSEQIWIRIKERQSQVQNYTEKWKKESSTNRRKNKCSPQKNKTPVTI